MALTLLSANNASTVLSAGISASSTTLTVNTGTGGLFPSPVSGTSFFKLTLIDAATGTLTEIVHVTARTGDTMTIVRGQEGTVSRLWSANDIAANMMTAGTLSLLAQKDLTLQISNNLSEIAAAGAVAQAAARVNLGIAARLQKFTASGSFTVPAGVTTLYISGCAGGGGGGGGSSSTASSSAATCGGSGGAGQSVQRVPVSVTPGQIIPVVIGNGGTAGAGSATGTNASNGGSGGVTSLGSLMSLTPGSGGGGGMYGTSTVAGGVAGSGYPAGGAAMASVATGSAYILYSVGGSGSSTAFGGGGACGTGGGLSATSGGDAFGYGSSGGGGGSFAATSGSGTGKNGGSGAPGVIFIEW